MDLVIHPFEVYLVPLDPTQGSEMRKTRPCVVVSPSQMNDYVRTILIAPMTSTPRPYPFRINCRFAGHDGQIALDQIRCVDRSRLVKRLGTIDDATARIVRAALVKSFR